MKTPPIPLSYHTPEPRRSRARFGIAVAIILPLIVAGFLGLRWENMRRAARMEAQAMLAARQKSKPLVNPAAGPQTRPDAP